MSEIPLDEASGKTEAEETKEAEAHTKLDVEAEAEARLDVEAETEAELYPEAEAEL